jgi:hypothetical protein
METTTNTKAGGSANKWQVVDKNNSRRGRNNTSNNNNATRNSTKFKGVNKDALEGIVISEGSNVPISQQFDTSGPIPTCIGELR